MEQKREALKNDFGKRLEQLLLATGLKSATLAAALNYDVSYISKWITGKALPSRKNIEKILTTVSTLAVSQCSAPARQALEERFGVAGEELLGMAVADALRDAYCAAAGELNESRYANNAALKLLPRGKFPLLDELARQLRADEQTSIVVMADLFSLERAAKLHLAGIDEGHFRLTDRNPRLSIDYIVDLRTLDGNEVYDVILLIHMMTNFSQCDFRLFAGDSAAGKLILAVREKFGGVTLLANRQQFLCTTSTRDRKAATELHDALKNLIDPDDLIFSPTDMDDMLQNREYFRNLLSRNNRWLVGHVTEHFLPEELFGQLLEQHFARQPGPVEEARRAYLLAENVLRKHHVRLMLYSPALVDFMLTGELDFFNRRVILSPEQRKEVLRHIKGLLESMPEDTVKLVKEGFSEDFKYITNPCLFLSDASPYLRLENKRYQDNLLVVKHERVRQVFDGFFEKIWNSSQDKVIAEHPEILRKLDSLLEMLDLL